MKLVKEDIKNREITVIPLDSDDLYTLYNVIVPGDIIRSKTSRRIKRGDDGTEGSSRLLVDIKILTESIEFQGFGDIIRIKGKIIETTHSHVTIGSYHTIKIELLKQLTIEKENWAEFELDKIRESQLGMPSGLLIVTIDDQSAMVAQVGTHATRILLDLTPSITRKGSDPSQNAKETQKFFKELAKFIHDKKKEGIGEHIVIGGPGFTRESFTEYLKQNYRGIFSDWLSLATNSVGRPGIREIITDHIPENYIAGKTAKLQASLIQRCLEEIGKNTGLIAYGSDVYTAADLGAIEYLLVLDTELRKSVEERAKIQTLIGLSKKTRSKSIIMSSMHDSGELLKGLGGIAALLRFKLPKK
ncbi:MAG: mRNA surveillance protein pelota [Candidatus Kariarchaeaceae archaeon]